MPALNLNEPPEPERDSINLDYRILSLVLFCATRADLFDDYLNSQDTSGWSDLQKLGLPHNLLLESHYLFKLPETQRALRQLQLVTQTLVALNDYCDTGCPTARVLRQNAWFNGHQSEPLPRSGFDPE